MAKVFLSHSSKDKDFVRRLANDLRELGHTPWLDEWQIRVGDCIVSKIQEGIAAADYVILILTPEAVASGWVDREWKDAYWTEINARRMIVLPVLLRPCDVPSLIRTKKYADFTRRYELGLAQLTQAILPPQLEEPKAELALAGESRTRITELIATLQRRVAPLGQVMADGLSLAHDLGNHELAEFCSRELAGWDEPNRSDSVTEVPAYRSFPIYISLGYLNPMFAGWGKSAAGIFSYMEMHPNEFFPRRSVDSRPIAQLDAQASDRPESSTAYLHWTQPLSDVNPDSDTPDVKVHCYARADSYAGVLEAIRGELTKRLVALLPPVARP